MEHMRSPKIKIRMRKQNAKVLNQMREMGESEIVSIISANRMQTGDDPQAMLRPSLEGIDKKLPLMKDLNKAAERLAKAVINNETIALCVDFDVDGISSGVVLKSALVEYFGANEKNVRLHVNRRLEFGYGFNPRALDVILEHDPEHPPTLLITADQGSNDNDQVVKYKQYMKSKGYEDCDVIITDHHEINSDDAGQDAYAFVNPQQKDCDFDDKTICGCVVALFLCVQTRLYLEKFTKESGTEKTYPSVEGLIPFACMATIADCVSLKSQINRFIIRYGKHALQKGDIPSFKVIRAKINETDRVANPIVTTKDIAFSLAPRINADSRTGGDGMTAANFLMAKNEEEALYYWEKLTSRNEQRKEEERTMVKDAMLQASKQYYDDKRRAFTIYLPHGNHGIHGIVASRIKEKFNCPVIIFSPVDLESDDDQERELSGSGRSVENIFINEVLSEMQENGVSFQFGGHKMALGVKQLRVGGLEEFTEAFDEGVKNQAKQKGLDIEDFFTPSVVVDHVLGEDLLPLLRNTEVLSLLDRLDPYGQKFDSPCFAINVRIESFRLLGKNNEHVKIRFQDTSGHQFDVMFFGYDTSPIYGTLLKGGEYTLAVELIFDGFWGKLGMHALAITEGYNNIAS